MTDQTKIKHEKVAPRQNSWSCHAGRVVWIQDKVWLELWMVKVKDDYCDLQPPYFKWRRDTPGNDRIDTRLQIDRYYRYLLPSTFSIYSCGENVEMWTLISWQWIHWIQWWSSGRSFGGACFRLHLWIVTIGSKRSQIVRVKRRYLDLAWIKYLKIDWFKVSCRSIECVHVRGLHRRY